VTERGGVVAAVESLAAEAGGEILRAGGNAADAAVAAAFAQAVVNPIHTTIAGSFHGLFHNSQTGATTAVTSGGRAPLAARDDMWELDQRWGAIWTVKDKRNRLGHGASMVPGFVRGAEEAIRRFGSGAVSWKQVVAPAIRLASDGFDVYPYLYRLWMPPNDRMHGFLELDDGPTVMSHTGECARVYLHPDGSVYRIGERLVLEDYAETLGRIADQGPDEFYEGETARRMVDDFAANGGLITAEDLRRFRADVTAPLETTFRDLVVQSEPAPSVGPVNLEVLNIIEGWDLRNLGWNSPEYLQRLARAMHLGFVDRMQWLADPDFVDVPTDTLISKRYAAELRGRIDAGTERETIGQVWAEHVRRSATTHVTVVDNRGDAAAITSSSGVSSGVVTPGLGFHHNCHMIGFDPVPGRRNSIAPWKRAVTGGGPAFFLKDGKMWLAIGSPAGSRKVTAIVQALLNIVDFGMSPQEAMSVDRIHVEDDPMRIFVEPGFDSEALLGIADKGFDIELEWFTARLTGVMRHEDGSLEGGVDPRSDRGLVVV
jgi:gamma-glutamyltranspeptidase/glutathione hydrolase